MASDKPGPETIQVLLSEARGDGASQLHGSKVYPGLEVALETSCSVTSKTQSVYSIGPVHPRDRAGNQHCYSASGAVTD